MPLRDAATAGTTTNHNNNNGPVRGNECGRPEEDILTLHRPEESQSGGAGGSAAPEQTHTHIFDRGGSPTRPLACRVREPAVRCAAVQLMENNKTHTQGFKLQASEREREREMESSNYYTFCSERKESKRKTTFLRSFYWKGGRRSRYR